MPSDENLQKRGHNLASICCLCSNHFESSDHIFLSCPLTLQIWGWLSMGSDQHLDLSLTSWSTLTHSGQGLWSNFVQQVMTAAILHTIWIERNSRIFQGKCNIVDRLINMIIASVKLIFVLMLKKSSNTMEDFKVMHLFGLSAVYSPVVVSNFVEVCWLPPRQGYIKVNIDGSAIGMPFCGAIGGISGIGRIALWEVSRKTLVMLLDLKRSYVLSCLLSKNQ